MKQDSTQWGIEWGIYRDSQKSFEAQYNTFSRGCNKRRHLLCMYSGNLACRQANLSLDYNILSHHTTIICHHCHHFFWSLWFTQLLIFKEGRKERRRESESFLFLGFKYWGQKSLGIALLYIYLLLMSSVMFSCKKGNHGTFSALVYTPCSGYIVGK